MWIVPQPPPPQNHRPKISPLLLYNNHLPFTNTYKKSSHDVHSPECLWTSRAYLNDDPWVADPEKM